MQELVGGTLTEARYGTSAIPHDGGSLGWSVLLRQHLMLEPVEPVEAAASVLPHVLTPDAALAHGVHGCGDVRLLETRRLPIQKDAASEWASRARHGERSPSTEGRRQLQYLPV